jgi:hypothetical protein
MDRKSGGVNQFSDYVPLNGVTPQQVNAVSVAYSWTDTPMATVFGEDVASAEELSAIESVTTYLGALMVVDVFTAKRSLSPKILEARQSLLDNPVYPDKLRNAYLNTSDEVTGSKLLSAGNVQINVKISLNQRDIIHSRFTLENVNQ